MEKFSSPESLRIWRLLAGVSLDLYGILLLLSLVLPIYELKGPIEGSISLLRYNVYLYGTPIHVDALDRASLLSIPLLAVALASLILGSLLILQSFKRESKPILMRISFALSLAFPSVSALAYLSRLVLVGEAMREIPSDLGSVTSAGILITSPVQIFQGPALPLLSPLLSIFPPVIVMSLTAVSAYLNVYSFLEKDLHGKRTSETTVHS
ncbi:MAG: hypothetical protein C0179_04860 [Fervidicoccus sp.]|nr:MAG: hypothetical protein C0179_04860 [Fervidicoccus sp.]